MFGGVFGGSNTNKGQAQPMPGSMPGMNAAQMDPNAQLAAAEQEMEMVTEMFANLGELCKQKCIIQRYHDEELSKAESVCIDRCVSKYFQVNRVVNDKLAKLSLANQQG
ncbi:protein transporter tim10 [Coemansia spiralis]|uniref:Mitochondrial import inner membrane translocase subunit n=2 Tax=Coemansia TaxID=4863 RepID=A0A9W8G238_9FUNG|nr:Tim10/DDP family zinc finger-domain-containing protein [Coemansia spiralis]KAJ1987024.1 protein transporter tim10 [Coemansia umbellata]KAJ2619006.1 protein transporter tim10 [Coemansia sp. RSA 1358]KAJ2668499.1 protein transporter tim10 [Coemansia spiralis]